jgi:GNAT superfamily N-acetyltransferase
MGTKQAIRTIDRSTAATITGRSNAHPGVVTSPVRRARSVDRTHVIALGPTSQPVKTVRLHPGNRERLRAIRLRALRDAPDAFGTTFDEAEAESLESWERQREQLATFVATAGGCDTGLARGARHDHVSGTGYLLSMWVAPEARRQGIGIDLIDAVLDWARKGRLNRLLLDVAKSNPPARALYTQKGFEPNGACGTLPPPRESVREIQLEMKL